MIRNPVDSSVIASIAYDPDLRVLGVFFRDGKRAAIVDVSAEEFAAFMAAPSKGNHYFRVFFKRAAGVVADNSNRQVILDSSTGSTSIPLREPEPLGPLETFTHDDCCSRRLQKSDRAGKSEWECPKCGTVWRKISRGELLNWEPEVPFFVKRM